MTTFAELETLVIGQTRRPEIPAVTKAAIRTATLRAHHTDFFPRDLVSGALTWEVNNSALFQDFQSVSNILVRMRSIKFIYGNDAVTSVPVEKLEYRDTDDIYDSDGVLRPSVYNLIGDTLRCYFQQPTGLATVFYYRNPLIADAQYSSWIADAYPDELAAWAAAIVFARTGYAEMAQEFQRNHITPFKEMLIASHLLGNVS